NRWIDEMVDSIGFRVRGNTSRVSAKKSFKVSFNTFVPGREFYGVDKLNLNGEHNDPSIVRSKLCWDAFNSIGMRSSRAAHTKVFINDVYYGLYISVEHIDDEFLEKHFTDDTGNLWKCLYPADLNDLGSDPAVYRDLEDNGRPVYELKTNEEANDFSQLARLIQVINNTPDATLPDSVEHLLDVTGVLQYTAMNVLLGSWDDYWSLANNYYLYYEPARDRFTLIPYDYDNTFGIDWFDVDWTSVDPYNFPKVVDGYRPLVERLLDNAQYADLYTHFLEFYNDNVLDLTRWEARIDSLRAMIAPAAAADTFRTLDYNFSYDDFWNSYAVTGYTNQHVKRGLKEFIQARHNTLPAQLNYTGAPPVIYAVDWSPANPDATDSILVDVAAFASEGLAGVTALFLPDNATDTLYYPVSANPVFSTLRVEDIDRWRAMLPPIGAAGGGKLWIRAEDEQGQMQTYPRSGSIQIQTPVEVSGPVINEFMADNDNVVQDPAGDYDDWLELYNHRVEPFLFTGCYLTDKPDNLTKWQFSQDSLILQPGEYLVVWCDEDEDQPGVHTNFKLSKSGEFLALVAPDGVSVIDSLSFGAQETDLAYGRYPDGGEGWSFLDPTPGYPNQPVNVHGDPKEPDTFTLAAYPNPFNPTTTIDYTIPEPGAVTISIFNLRGERVWEHHQFHTKAGPDNLQWSGVDESGQSVSAGVYFVRINATDLTRMVKVTLLK
ncbi:MAG: CotH kinase family protein, partial [Candidatus Marinimicrobia bacterium]|nr:CotH kinase family protein [Candidatus Neomarinimicrobiota bacterium]